MYESLVRCSPLVSRIVVLAAAIATVLAAADVTGKWKGTLGERETVLTLRMDGNAIAGTMSGAEGKEHPLKGKLDGDKISFTVDSEWQGNPVKLVANGTFEGDEMKLNIGTEDGSWSSELTAKRQ